MKSLDLGFGTSGLMGSAWTDRGRLSLLEYAFELGIKHFDTAPLYGMGDAEAVVGKFIKTKRDQITVASKFGLPANPLGGFARVIKPIARPLSRRVGLIKKLSQSALKKTSTPKTQTSALPTQESKLSVAEFETALESSLRMMRLDYLDYFLFHEASLAKFSDELLRAMQEAKRLGKIRHYGLAGGTDQTTAILQTFDGFDGVVQLPCGQNLVGQHDWHERGADTVIIHSWVRTHINQIIAVLARQPEVARGFQGLASESLCDADLPLWLLLQSLAHHYPSGLALFSSRKQENIAQIVRLAAIDVTNEQKFERLLASFWACCETASAHAR